MRHLCGRHFYHEPGIPRFRTAVFASHAIHQVGKEEMGEGKLLQVVSLRHDRTVPRTWPAAFLEPNRDDRALRLVFDLHPQPLILALSPQQKSNDALKAEPELRRARLDKSSRRDRC